MAQVQFIHRLLALQELDAQAEASASKLEGARVLRGVAREEVWLAALKAERERVAAAIPAAQLAIYESLRRRGELFPWVVVSRTTTCVACNSTAMTVVALGQGAAALRQCRQCTRLVITPGPGPQRAV